MHASQCDSTRNSLAFCFYWSLSIAHRLLLSHFVFTVLFRLHTQNCNFLQSNPISLQASSIKPIGHVHAPQICLPAFIVYFHFLLGCSCFVPFLVFVSTNENLGCKDLLVVSGEDRRVVRVRAGDE